jgi:hypothetical protein
MSTYAEWAETHQSDINGEGWGSDHLWHYEATPSNASVYKCARCFWPFAHYYRSKPDIFKAMQMVGVPDKCARQQLWPIRPEYASAEEKEQFATLRAAISKAGATHD